jgi:uncharacterized integral membrane protein
MFRDIGCQEWGTMRDDNDLFAHYPANERLAIGVSSLRSLTFIYTRQVGVTFWEQVFPFRTSKVNDVTLFLPMILYGHVWCLSRLDLIL